MRLIAPSIRGYRREWLAGDLVAGAIVGSVVVPQAVAYAQIAGLPPSAGLAAAPGALIGYALLGTSRSLVVSATTATSALSLAAVGPLADGNAVKFAALSAALALVSALMLAAAGVLRLGGVMDLVSTPVMTGFLFGLGLTVAMSQLPKLFGVPAGSGNFFPRLADLVRDLDKTSGWTLAIGLGSVAALILLRRVGPGLPSMLIVLAGAIVVSALANLDSRGVAVVGKLPSALPDPALPDVGWHDLVDLLPAAAGMLILSAEAAGVSRAIASAQGYRVDVNRDLVALGGANLLAGFSSGFVQSGGASQTMAGEQAGGKSQLSSVVAAGIVLITGAFLTFLFKDLPQATLAAIVIVAISGFFRVDELRRFLRIRHDSFVVALVALVGVLLLGVLPGLLIAVLLSLVLLIKRLSRPPIVVLARDPRTGAWARADGHPRWTAPPGLLVVRTEGPLFYANSVVVKEHLTELVRSCDPRPDAIVIDLSANHELDVETLDMLGELADALASDGVALRLGAVHANVREILRRGGFDDRIAIELTLDAAATPGGADRETARAPLERESLQP
jgi:high affinity sulfate transporter 1